MRRILRALFWGLAVVGLLAVLLAVWSIIPGTVHFGPPIVSPNRAHKAILMTYRGGTGLMSYCNAKISILDFDVPAENGQSDDAIVFEEACDRISLADNRAEASAEIEWVAADTLKITFSIPSTYMHTVVRLRSRNHDGLIRVKFEIRD